MDGFIFYRSFADATKGLNDSQYRQVMDAIIGYALDGRIPEDIEPVLQGYFLLIKPQIDANNARLEAKREAGHKGGLSKASRTVAERSTSVAEVSTDVASDSTGVADGKQTEAINIKEKVKVKVKEKVKHKYGTFGHVLLADDEVQKLEADFGKAETDEAINYLDVYMERKGYKTKSHYLAIRKWVFDAVKEDKLKKRELEEREKRLTGKEKPKDGIKRNNDLDQWLQQRTAERLNGIS